MLILDPKLKVKSVSCLGKMGNKTLKGKLIEQAIKEGTTAVPQGEEVFRPNYGHSPCGSRQKYLPQRKFTSSQKNKDKEVVHRPYWRPDVAFCPGQPAQPYLSLWVGDVVVWN